MISITNFLLVFILQWQMFFFGAETVKKNYHPPLTIPLVLAANFGELRSNHFHMGLDFKTNRVEGQTLHSIDEGYIARVTVSPYGYGRVVYINHPGGITSVYAHCQRLTGRLHEKVRAYQMKVKNSEADLYFQPNEIPMKRGEVFALSGNTGSSSGPHLHFEIRDTYTEAAINPLKFGFDIQDHQSPNLFQVKLYGVDEFGYLFPGKEKEYNIKNGTIDGGTITLPAEFAHTKGGLGFALNGVDRFDAANNPCGLYGTTLIVNNDTIMHQEIDEVPFEHTRYINTYTDYKAYRKGRKYHKAFHSTMNPLEVYKSSTDGILNITPGNTYQVEYIAFDYTGNTSKIDFTLNIEDGIPNNEKSVIYRDDYIDPLKGWSKNWSEASLHLPINCAFEPIPKQTGWDGEILFISGDSWPVQEAFKVKMKALDHVPKKQQYLAVKSGKGYRYLKTTVIGDYLEAKSKYFGQISIQTDDSGPYIQSVNVRGIVSKKQTKRLVWKMGDYKSGLMNYGLWIDGEWNVLDYESKGDYAFFEIDELAEGSHDFKIVASDYCGNETEANFTLIIQ